MQVLYFSWHYHLVWSCNWFFYVISALMPFFLNHCINTEFYLSFGRNLMEHKHRTLSNGNSKSGGKTIKAPSHEIELTTSYNYENTVSADSTANPLPSQGDEDPISFAWKRLAIAFDRFCGTVLGIFVACSLLYAVICFQGAALDWNLYLISSWLIKLSYNGTYTNKRTWNIMWNVRRVL